MTESYLPVLSILIPVLAIFLIPFLDEKKTNILTSVATFFSFIVILLMYPFIRDGKILEIGFNTDLLIYLSFRVDALSYITGLVASILWTLASVYSIGYMEHGHSLKRYNIFSLLSYVGMLGVPFTGNLFSLYIFFELLSVASYVMVIHEETEEAKSAGLVYLFMGVTGGLILLFSMIATYSIAGTGDFSEFSRIGIGLQRLHDSPYFPLIFFGFILGFGVKAGLFPVHIWLPMAHPVAPAPGSALLSGVMIKAGAYGILRTIFSIVGWEFMKGQWFLYIIFALAAINIFLGSAVAIKQTEIKRMLAYSSIAQIGYIILGAVLLSYSGLIGSALHIFNHAFIKGTLFLCAGAIIHQTGLRQISDFEGMGKRMPITMICFTIASLSMIGFPPFNGFITKWHLLIGALESVKTGNHPFSIGIFAIVLLLVSSFMNLMYYGPIIYSAWFKSPKKTPGVGEPHGKEGEKPLSDSDILEEMSSSGLKLHPITDNIQEGKIHDIAHYTFMHPHHSGTGGSKDIHKDKAHGGSVSNKDIKSDNVKSAKGKEAPKLNTDNHEDHSGGHGGSSEEEKIETCDPSMVMLVPLIILTAGIVIFGLIPIFPVSLAQKVSLFYFH